MKIYGILIGGILPALLFGISTVLMKQSTKEGISTPTYLFVVGLAVTALGAIAMLFGGHAGSTRAWWAAAGAGVTWGLAGACMTYAFTTLKLPVAVVGPLTNASALVSVLLAAWVFSEWQDLNVTKVLLGTVLICVGAGLVSSS